MSFPVCMAAMAILTVCLLLALYHYLRLRIQYKSVQAQLRDETLKEQQLVSELSELKTQANIDRTHDGLTGLPSRQVLEDRLLLTVNQSKRYQLLFGIIFLDIDGFKVINNALGYEVGDELLKEISKRLLGAVRQVDTVCRFGGDSFAFLLPQIAKPETTVYIAQRLLTTIAQPFHINNQDLFVTASIGISVYPGDGADGNILLKNADNAMNQSKLRGPNAYQFYRQEMQELSQRELSLNSCLHDTSIYNEFTIHYQPIVNTKTKEITCMEALLRWQHPVFGLITPHEFLRLAENNGKIIEIGEWVLRTACLQFQKWKQLNLHLKSVAVNISLRQLENPHFIYKLTQILEETKMGPECLVLEISEGVFHKVDLLEKSLQMLKRLGVQVSIDDFGTGRLSLLQLKRLAIDYLKVDGSFVEEISINPESESIVKMVIALADGLHQHVVAEGVETLQQKQLLEQWGCHLMQGHLFSVPRHAEEFTPSIEREICGV